MHQKLCGDTARTAGRRDVPHLTASHSAITAGVKEEAVGDIWSDGVHTLQETATLGNSVTCFCLSMIPRNVLELSFPTGLSSNMNRKQIQ